MRESPAFWWDERHPLGVLLAPLGGLYALFMRLRHAAYRAGVLRSRRIGRPVVVVGNLCAGGTGKTPLVIAVAGLLARHGLRAGIVCRGYGGGASRWPQLVRPDSDPALVGDEAVLLARRTGCPVAAGPNRVAAIRDLFRRSRCDVVLSDDGLQHLRLARDVEIVAVDGARRHGNLRCLPAGPLREPPDRLESVDLVVVNGEAREGELGMRLVPGDAVSLADGETTRPLDSFRGAPVHAVCGIGHPERFFHTLEDHGMTVVRHPFADHHPFREAEIRFADDAPVLMTEKDAVKCERFADARHWYVPVEAVLSDALETRLAAVLRGRGIAEEPEPSASSSSPRRGRRRGRGGVKEPHPPAQP